MKKNDNQTFKSKLERLEKISELLENEDTDINESIKLYEEGVKLIKDCAQLLQNAELKITELKMELPAGFNGIEKE